MRWMKRCPYLLEKARVRGVNALNMEPGATFDRCREQPPASWKGVDPGGRRWLGSGGSIEVFGKCIPCLCPLNRPEAVGLWVQEEKP